MYNAATNCSTIFEKDMGKVVDKPSQYTEVGYLLLLFVVVVVVIKSRASKARTGAAGEL